MGQFNSGLWIIGIILYYFIFFLLTFSAVSAFNHYGIDASGISANDPGFQTASNDPMSQGGECIGAIPLTCGGMNADDNTTCSMINGCTWDATDLRCEGFHQEGACDTPNPLSPNNGPRNESFCNILGCHWSSYSTSGSPATVDPDDTFDWSSVKNTIGVMSGFSADIGIPSAFQWIFSFIFFWVPFFALLWAVYMALPFVH